MKQILFLITVFVFTKIEAQVSLTIQVPPMGVVQKSQLWNLTLVNSGSNALTVFIEMTLLEANQPVMKATSKPFTLGSGIKQLKEADVLPVNTNYINPSFALSQNSNTSLLPVGDYEACYAVTYFQGEVKVILAEECISLIVEPLSPPLLNTPSDQQQLQTRYPQFTWLPPAPVTLFTNLNYSISVVEVLQNQTAVQAIQSNLPVYTRGSQKYLYSQYPSTYKPLDTGRVYAWRIIANNNNQFIAQSDVWTFKVGYTNPTISTTDQAYIKLKRGAEASFILCRGVIKFEYDNQAEDATVAYTIKNIRDGSIVKEGMLKIKPGQNFITLKESSLANKGNYLFELSNSRNETWALKFDYMEAEISQ